MNELDIALLESLPKPAGPMAPFPWVGGKGNLAEWVMAHFPPRARVQVYVEPYAGAASVFWRLPRPYPVEVLNDLDRRIVNLYRTLQDPETFQELAHRLLWTPYAREEFARALDILKRWDEYTPVERAWAFFVAQGQGFGGKASQSSWGRVFVAYQRGAENTGRWQSRLASLLNWHRRLLGVQIDCRDALEVIRYWDTPSTLFYVDPPYYQKGGYYEVDPGDEHHERLVDTLLQVKGMVLLSGYDAPPYRRLEEAGWWRRERLTASHLAGRIRGSGLQGKEAAKAKAPRVEVLWGNYSLGEAVPLLEVEDDESDEG